MPTRERGEFGTSYSKLPSHNRIHFVISKSMGGGGNSTCLRLKKHELKKKEGNKKLYINADRSIIHSSPKMETTQMSISWGTDKQNV